MVEFFEALGDPDAAFLRYALAMGLLSSVAFGILGTYVVVRRITYLADAIAHCVLGGIGAALYLQSNLGMTWCDPTYGAVVAALLAAVGIGLVSLYARQREDTVITVVWVSGVAIGLLLMQKVHTPGGTAPVDPMAYLFGDILLISRQDVQLVAWLDVAILALVALFRHKFVAVCFDDEFAELRGIHAKAYYLLLLCLTALTVVLLVRIVGIILVVALLALPAAIAGLFSRQLWQMMALGTLGCAAFITFGLAFSYAYDFLRTGPTIILFAASTYVVTTVTIRLLRPGAIG